MGLSDPFSTTYEGSRQAGMSLGAGIESAAGSVADVMKQKAKVQQEAKQRQQAFGLLKQFGLVSQDQPSNDDLSKGLQDFGAKSGYDVTVTKGQDENATRKNLIGIYKALNIPMPQGKITVNPGVTMDMGGGTSYTAPKQEKTMAQQIMEYQQASKALSDAGSPGIPTVDSKGGLSIKSPTGAVKDVNATAKIIVDGIASGNLPPTLTGMSRTAGLSAAIEVEAQKRGFNLKQAQVDYTALTQLTKTMNQNQMVQLNTAFNSVENDISPLRQLNTELDRTNINLANKFIVSAKSQGITLDPSATKEMNDEQIKTTAKFVTQINLTRDNMAVAFMRGGVPTDQAFKLTDDILKPVYGAKYIDAALDQVQFNINLRRNAVANNPPFVPGQAQGQASPQSVLGAAGMGGAPQPQKSKYSLVE